MLPEQPISFPEFVADQLLTAKNLNDLFHYLDVQERGTRINLIGIGIVCGLELKVNSAGTEVTITKGCGITSLGYLVRWEETKYQNYKVYDAAKEIVYDRFYAGGAKKFDLDELKANSSEEGLKPLSNAYLEDKVAMLFVELMRIDAKNCDPESCDDKGSNVTLTIRPLLVEKKYAAQLTGGVAGGNSFNQSWISLPELRMPRHHLPAANIFDSGDVFEGFQKVLSGTFLGDLEKGLSQTYTRIQPLVQDIYTSNPFSGLANDFAFIHNGTISVQQMLYLQYYYDLFSDVVSAYEELRKVGMKLLSLCCPDEGLFPRHLLLGATGGKAKVKLEFRHYFIPSPAVSCHHNMVDELRSLFKRLVLLIERFNLQASAQIGLVRNEANLLANFTRGTNVFPIRITPSKYGDVPLSEKSIPFYYDVIGGADKLYEQWNYQRARAGTADQQLSYHAPQYNNSHPHVLQPLQYDWESYNFFRIEGHVGQSYRQALATINQIRDSNRLPFDVVALSADVRTLRETLELISSGNTATNFRQGIEDDIAINCHFQDLEALYDTMAQSLLCNLCKEMKYYYDFPATPNAQHGAKQKPEVPLLQKCDPAFQYKEHTIGALFEDFYKEQPVNAYIEPEQFFGGALFGTANSLAMMRQEINYGLVLGLAILYYIEKLSEILPTTLISLNMAAFRNRYADLMLVLQKAKEMHQVLSIINLQANKPLDVSISEDIIDHLDSLLLSCKDAAFEALYNDYRIRWVYLSMLQKLGYYVKMHPAIQHKAGVTAGGTFILVYHERPRRTAVRRDIFIKESQRTTRYNYANEAHIAKVVSNAKPAENATGNETKTAGNEKERMYFFASNPAAEHIKERGDLNEAKGTAAQEHISAQSKQTKNVYQLSYNKLKTHLTKKQLNVIEQLFFKDLITRHTLDELTTKLPDRIVIADFFLPYMCCSDCPPVYYIVNEPEEEKPKPTVSIKETQFCGGDDTAYPVTVTPAGGSFGNAEGVTENNGVFSFTPSSVNIPAGSLNKIVQLTYTKDGESASVSVTVFAKPKAAFDLMPATTYNFFVFSNKSESESSILWDFGDGATDTTENPSHVFQKDGVYIVKLTAKNGVCTDTISKTVTVARASIIIDGKEFCSDDTGAYQIHVSPEGGSVTGDGTSKGADGKFVFKPAAVAFTGSQASKDVLLSYNVSGQFVQTSVKVHRMPSAAFTVSNPPGTAGGNIKAFQTSNPFPAQYLWDFGDGGTSKEQNPFYQYKKPGEWLVKLTVTNGTCQNSSSQMVSIIQASVSLTPAEFCSIDKKEYPINASPEGGTAMGEGVIKSEAGFVFQPASVVFDGSAASKDVIISYNAEGHTAKTGVKVFHTPSASFAVSDSTASAAGNVKAFSVNNPFPAQYQWDFGDGDTSTLQNPTHEYKEANTYEVKLTVTNGPCQATFTKKVTVAIKLTMSLQQTQFCSIDTKSYPVTVSPAGGVVSGEGVSGQGNSFVFAPAKVNIPQSAASKDVQLSYTAAGQTITSIVKVFRTPASGISVVNSGNPQTKAFTTPNNIQASFLWNFGDGNTATSPNPVHKYAPGSYKVTVKVTNGPCVVTSETTVNIPSPVR